MRGKANSRLTTATRVVILTAVYFLGGILGKEAAFLSGSIALVWPPAGIALAAILLFGYRFWPGVALGAVLFSFMNGVPFGFFTLGTAIGNTTGAIVCTFLLRRFVSFDNAMERTKDVVGYIGLACFLGTTVNATFNIVGLAYAGEVTWSDLFPSVVEWWVPNALAGLVVAPFITAWSVPSSIRWKPKLILEAAICGVGLVAGTLVSFQSWFVYGIQNYPLAYLPFPFLVWGALRFGQRGATTGTLLVSALAIQSLIGKRGPFVTTAERESLMLIGSYIGILAVTNMLLAAAAAERQRAERATSASEKRFRGVVEDQTDLICRFNPDGELTFVNGAYCRFHGKTKEDLLGTDFLQTLAGEDRAIPLSFFQALPPEQPTVFFDHRVVTPDGRIVWQQYTVRRLFPEKGEKLEFQAVIQDITHRKQSEEDLRASEEKYRSLVANIPDVVWTVNAKPELTYVSDNVEKILGYKRDQLIGAGNAWWRERTDPNDIPNLQLPYEKLFKLREPLDAEFRFRRSDGQWIWLQSRAPAAHVRAGALCANGLLSDITQRKRVEAALHQAKIAAEAASRSKSQFLANMSHELRTPLNAIIGFSEILSDKTFGELNERQDKYIHNILASGRHLLQLINDILDLSKVEAGRLELSVSSFNLAKALANVQAIVKTLAYKKSIDLEVAVAADVPHGLADEAKFKQIMYNLLSNAIKFTPEGGKVSVTAKRETNPQRQPGLEALFSASDQCLRVEVMDTGIGILPRDHERIFAEFEQVDSSYGRQQQGTGLGLALTRRLIEMHGGRIWVESKGVEGEGSRFIFVLPLPKSLLTDSAHPQTSASELSEILRPCVLIITCDRGREALLNDYLSSVGYGVLRVDKPEDVSMTMRGRRPYAIVVDEKLAENCSEKKFCDLRRMWSGLPIVRFSVGAEGKPRFTLFLEHSSSTAASKARLVDALQKTRPPRSKEVKRVLVIDDEPALSELLAKTLLCKGFQVLQAGDGRQGLALAASCQPDIVILDLSLPECHGVQVLEHLHRDSATRNIPVLIHTGIALAEEERQRLAAHAYSISFKTENDSLLANLESLDSKLSDEMKA